MTALTLVKTLYYGVIALNITYRRKVNMYKTKDLLEPFYNKTECHAVVVPTTECFDAKIGGVTALVIQ